MVENLKNLFIRKFSKSYFNKELSYQEIKEKLDSK